MRTPRFSASVLVSLLRDQTVATLSELIAALGTQSRRTDAMPVDPTKKKAKLGLLGRLRARCRGLHASESVVERSDVRQIAKPRLHDIGATGRRYGLPSGDDILKALSSISTGDGVRACSKGPIDQLGQSARPSRRLPEEARPSPGWKLVPKLVQAEIEANSKGRGLQGSLTEIVRQNTQHSFSVEDRYPQKRVDDPQKGQTSLQPSARTRLP